MVFPVVESRTASVGGSPSTSWSVDMPASVSAGDLLWFTLAVNGDLPFFDTPSGWTFNGVGDQGGGFICAVVFSKVSDGTEGGTTVTVTQSGTSISGNRSAICNRLSGGSSITVSIPITGSGTALEMPSLLLSAPAKDTVWTLVVCTGDDDVATTAASPGYEANLLDPAAGTGGNNSARIATSYIELNAVDESPGDWTIFSSEAYVAFLVAVEPVSSTIVAPVFDDPGYDNSLIYDDGDAISISPQFLTNPFPGANYSLFSGTLPDNLIIDSVTGVVSGTLDASGPQSFVVEALNSGGSDTASVGFDVYAAPDIAYFNSSKYLVSSPISILPVLTKGFPLPLYSIESGSLPLGLSLNPATGEISGSTAILGAVSVTIRATNSEGFGDAIVAFEIVSELPLGGGSRLNIGIGIQI